MISFKQFYIENNTAHAVFSNGAVDIGSTGNQFPSTGDAGYAPGDYRLPFAMGVFTRRGAKLKKRKTKTKLKQNAKSTKAKR